MKAVKISIEDLKVGNTFDMVRFIIRVITITKGLHLSETELYAITHFIINGYSKLSRRQLIENKLLTTEFAVNNLIHRLKKNQFIVKTAFGYDLNPDYKLSLNDIDIVKLEFLIKK